jgi:outer membrane protein assembly factor BamB
MTFRLLAAPAFLSIIDATQSGPVATATLVIAPTATDTGVFPASIEVNDDKGGADSASCQIGVMPQPVAGVVIVPDSGTLYVGDELQLSATVLSADGGTLGGRPIEWSSSDSTVAMVVGSGLVRSLAEGAAVVTASSEGWRDSIVIQVRSRIAWEFVTGAEVRSSPALGADGTIYIGSFDGKLYALNPDGTTKWALLMPPDSSVRVLTSPLLGSDGTIYVGTEFGGGSTWFGRVCAVTPPASVAWCVGGGVSQADLALGTDGTVYACLHDGTPRLYAIGSDGTVQWERDVACYDGIAVGTDGTIYAGTGMLTAFGADGSTKWSVHLGGYGGLAVAADGTLYVGTYSPPRLYAVAPDSTVRWSIDMQGSVVATPVVAADGSIYSGPLGRYLYAIAPDGSVLWEYESDWTQASLQSAPALGADGTVYVGFGQAYVGCWQNPAGQLVALAPDGSERWAVDIGGTYDASPAIAPDGTVYVGSCNGRVYAIHGTGAGLASAPWPRGTHDLSNTRSVNRD